MWTLNSQLERISRKDAKEQRENPRDPLRVGSCGLWIVFSVPKVIRSTKSHEITLKRKKIESMSTEARQVNQFSEALRINAPAYDVNLNVESIARLADYYHLLLTWNPRLHLVAPCSADEFAKRHILESLLLLHLLPQGARVVDIGSGAGLPIIPCLIARPDINAVMIESAKKKAVFLREALNLIGHTSSAEVIAERFEQLPTPNAQFITCRALKRFVGTLPRLLSWSPRPSTLLLFGGDELRESLITQKFSFEETHIPKSERRFLFVVKRP